MAHRIGQYDFSYPTVTNGKALANTHVERIAVAAKAGLQEPFENLVFRTYDRECTVNTLTGTLTKEEQR